MDAQSDHAVIVHMPAPPRLRCRCAHEAGNYYYSRDVITPREKGYQCRNWPQRTYPFVPRLSRISSCLHYPVKGQPTSK